MKKFSLLLILMIIFTGCNKNSNEIVETPEQVAINEVEKVEQLQGEFILGKFLLDTEKISIFGEMYDVENKGKTYEVPKEDIEKWKDLLRTIKYSSAGVGASFDSVWDYTIDLHNGIKIGVFQDACTFIIKGSKTWFEESYKFDIDLNEKIEELVDKWEVNDIKEQNETDNKDKWEVVECTDVGVEEGIEEGVYDEEEEEFIEENIDGAEEFQDKILEGEDKQFYIDKAKEHLKSLGIEKSVEMQADNLENFIDEIKYIKDERGEEIMLRFKDDDISMELFKDGTLHDYFNSKNMDNYSGKFTYETVESVKDKINHLQKNGYLAEDKYLDIGNGTTFNNVLHISCKNKNEEGFTDLSDAIQLYFDRSTGDLINYRVFKSQNELDKNSKVNISEEEAIEMGKEYFDNHGWSGEVKCKKIMFAKSEYWGVKEDSDKLLRYTYFIKVRAGYLYIDATTGEFIASIEDIMKHIN